MLCYDRKTAGKEFKAKAKVWLIVRGADLGEDDYLGQERYVILGG